MIVSLGEIEALTRKAARGTGWPWGYADELGVSARLLAASGQPGVSIAASLLQQPPTEHCPIRFAAIWCDRNTLPEHPATLTHGTLALPLLARHICKPGLCLNAISGGIQTTVDKTGFLCEQHGALIATDHAEFTFSITESSARHSVQNRGAATVDDTHWQTLEHLAIGSYVPASEQSRHGAGPSD